MRRSWINKLEALSAFDGAYWALGLVVAGIDEAGRGPLAGPVAAGCVILPREPLLPGVDDSKKLSPARREALFERILETAIFAKTGMASVAEIETLNIWGATKLAMARAAEGAPCDLFLVDGPQSIKLAKSCEGIVRGDTLSYHIAAASILAKVSRDRIMQTLDKEHPGYGFARHKGYGTREHCQAILRLGPCPAHRPSFLTKLLAEHA